MAQILDPLPNGQRKRLLCCYVNATSQIQIARITNIPNWYFERVVFPGQRLVFEALPDALLEIHTGMMASAIISDTIPCDRLWISDGDDDDMEEIEKETEPVLASTTSHRKQTIESYDNHLSYDNQIKDNANFFKPTLMAVS